MTRLLALLALATVMSGQSQSPDVARAEIEVTRLRELVAAGAVAPAKLRDAEANLAESRDQAVLARLLYGRLELEDLRAQDPADMIAAAERRVERQRERVVRLEKLVAAGVSSRADLEAAKSEMDARASVVSIAQGRARLFAELTEMAHAEQRAADLAAAGMLPGAIGPDMEYFPGKGRFNDVDFKQVSTAFEKQFSRPLPVSAKGETAAHRSLGFDHRGRVDIGLNPDAPEGLWLRQLLTQSEVPYIAFRRRIAGSSTAPHIHLGLPSPKLTLAEGN